MAHSRGSGFWTTRAQRRKTSWEIGPQTGTDGSAQVLSSSAATIATGAVTPGLPGVTVIRTRGELLLVLKSASVVGAGFHGAFGIGIASAAAVAAGIGSVPTPITEEGSENWLYHRYFAVVSAGVVDGTASTDSDPNTGAVLRVEVDSKAMRKFDDQLVIYAAIEVTEAGAATMDWYFNSRQLVKLP